MQSIRFALLGPGIIGNMHARILQAASSDLPVSLVAVAGRKEERARATAERFGAPKHSTCFDSVIQDPQVDACIVTSATLTHHDLIKKCIEAGKPVLTEKPASMKVSEIEDLLETHARQQQPAPVQVGYQQRMFPTYRRMK